MPVANMPGVEQAARGYARALAAAAVVKSYTAPPSNY
jgi:hypothetical protein